MPPTAFGLRNCSASPLLPTDYGRNCTSSCSISPGRPTRPTSPEMRLGPNPNRKAEGFNPTRDASESNPIRELLQAFRPTERNPTFIDNSERMGGRPTLQQPVAGAHDPTHPTGSAK